MSVTYPAGLGCGVPWQLATDDPGYYLRMLGTLRPAWWLRGHLPLWPMAFLAYHILGVVFGSTYPKMRRIAARRIVAMMADKHSFWYFSAIEKIRKAMNKIFLLKISKATISLCGFRSPPLPTLPLFTDWQMPEKGIFKAISNILEGESQMMPLHKPYRNTFNAMIMLVVYGRYSRLLPATAMTVAVRDFVGCLRGGMLTHVGRSFQRSGQTGGRCKRRSGHSFVGLKYSTGAAW